jgi:DNA-directed RNA polymerase specialized sigma24 family protein
MKHAVRAADEIAKPRDAWPVRPLTRTRRDNGLPYVREADVEAQVRAISTLSARERRERLLATAQAWDDAGRLREETLVYFLREFAARSDDDMAWQIAELLVERTASHVQRKLARWRLTPEDADDCTRDLFTALCEAVFDRGAAAEFWEVRFWVCLDRRLWNLIERRQAIADSEVRPSDQVEDGEGEQDVDRLFTRIADTGATPEVMAERAEALSLLTENERRAVYLCYIEGLPEESEDPERPSAAKMLGVTGRSIRNYLRRAKEKLMAWERGTMAA